jgi:heme-degrading monooxygenase HmoA
VESPAQSLVLINAFEVPEGREDEFIRGWEATRDYLRTQPGYVDTALHQAISPNPDFRFVNVGRWQSPEAFQQAVRSPGFQHASRALAEFRAHPALYRIIRT